MRGYIELLAGAFYFHFHFLWNMNGVQGKRHTVKPGFSNNYMQSSV